MLGERPTQTFRGTWDEIQSHRAEIPAGAVLELNVYPQVRGNATEVDRLSGRSLAEVIAEIGFAEGGPADLAAHAEDYLGQSDFGTTEGLRAVSE